jgi:hypothetical protein
MIRLLTRLVSFLFCAGALAAVTITDVRVSVDNSSVQAVNGFTATTSISSPGDLATSTVSGQPYRVQWSLAAICAALQQSPCSGHHFGFTVSFDNLSGITGYLISVDGSEQGALGPMVIDLTLPGVAGVDPPCDPQQGLTLRAYADGHVCGAVPGLIPRTVFHTSSALMLLSPPDKAELIGDLFTLSITGDTGGDWTIPVDSTIDIVLLTPEPSVLALILGGVVLLAALRWPTETSANRSLIRSWLGD